MRALWAGILIVLAALSAAPVAWAQETPTPTPTPTATPTPSPTPTPEEIAEAERKERLRKRKAVRRVYKDYEDGRIETCDHTRRALKLTLRSITDEFDTDFPEFREAVKAAIEDHDEDRCEREREEAEETPTPTPTATATPAPTSTPAPTIAPTPAPTTDSGDLPDLGGSGGGGGRKGGDSAPPAVEDSPPAPTESDVTPVQPSATPAPVAPAEPQLAVVRPEGDQNLLYPAILLLAALVGLALLGGSTLLARRSDRFAGWGHSVREATYRASGAWGDFGDWLRLGR